MNTTLGKLAGYVVAFLCGAINGTIIAYLIADHLLP